MAREGLDHRNEAIKVVDPYILCPFLKLWEMRKGLGTLDRIKHGKVGMDFRPDEEFFPRQAKLSLS